MDTSDLEKPEIKKLLDSKIGFFNLHSCFINYYLSKRLFNENPANNQTKTGTGSLQNTIQSGISCFLKRKPLQEADIMFISRYREKQTPHIRTDYLFDSVLQHTDKEYQAALVSMNYFGHYNRPSNENYNLMDGLSLFLIFQSLLTALILHIRFILIKSHLESPMKHSLNSFFSIQNLFVWCLNGFSLNNIHKKLKPRAIVANDDMQLLKPPGEKVPLITVQSATMSEDLEKRRSQLHQVLVSEEEKADVFCLSGPYFAAIKDKYLVDAQRTVITGQPRFDELFQLKRDYEEKPESKRDPGKIYLLWATQTHALSREENERNISFLSTIIRKMPHIQLSIKLHPGEDQEAPLYADLKRRDNVEILPGSASLGESLLHCDIMLTKYSTSTIDAAILGKNIIIMDFSETDRNQTTYLKSDISLEVYSEDALEKAITDLTQNRELSEEFEKGRANFIRDYNFSDDGASSLRVFEVIEQFLD